MFYWGRGVADDKGEIAAMTLALEAIYEVGVKLKGDLILTGNCDEEIGGVAGLILVAPQPLVRTMHWLFRPRPRPVRPSPVVSYDRLVTREPASRSVLPVDEPVKTEAKAVAKSGSISVAS